MTPGDSWTYRIDDFLPEDTVLNGNRFLLGNGYMGYRGTLEEFRKDQLAACTLNGVYDRVPGKWREPVNAPNGLYTQIEKTGEIVSHRQELNMRYAHMARHTVYQHVAVSSARFVSRTDVHLLCMEYTVRSVQPGPVVLHTGIDDDVWDINGPHLESVDTVFRDGLLCCTARTGERGITVAVCEAVELLQDGMAMQETAPLRRIDIEAEAGTEYTFRKYVAVFTSLDDPDPAAAAQACCRRALSAGYAALAEAHDNAWNRIWERSDVQIDGDEDAQFALRYSLYQLQLAAPRHSDRVSIPARGLSGQVYKGAVFWDTEMFMTPVFTLTEPAVARNLILYRCRTLEGARRKAAEYGYRGAFYAWEGQEDGHDACTHFNVTDVFTNRPMRTYFRDKQIHISADIVYAVWTYYEQTGDFSIFPEGAAEVAAECARFFYSYAYYRPEKQRYELVDVTGPDEYHERVHNNAYTNRMVQFTLETAVRILALLKEEAPEAYDALEAGIGFAAEIDSWRDMAERLYVPGPDPATGIIPQFDGYERLEEVSLEELKGRILDPNEYLGGGSGLATTTRILKQADVVLMLNLFRGEYPRETVRRNWEYYEPRTEHGSSLSDCAYAMAAAYIGEPERAYPYFMNTATIDLTGASKQYVGTLYIGGTHPAANGGAWLSAVLGFAGLQADENGIHAEPCLPAHWKGMSFRIEWRGRPYRIRIEGDEATVVAEKENCYA
jgi:trehalose/maltose hydrolase-like predicted phosphorylase